MEKMRFAVITKEKNAEIHERTIPELKDDEVLIKIEACNICTTDYEFWSGRRKNQLTPMAGGHENSGIIVKKGKAVSDYFSIGDRVGIMLTESCGVCPDCRKGNDYACRYKGETFKESDDGYFGFFGFSTYKTAKSEFLFKFTSDIPADEAGFIEPLSTAIRSIKIGDIKPEENVVIIGGGTMGLLNAQVARAYGARVIISELFESKVEVAKELGFTEFLNPKSETFKEDLKEILKDGRVNAIIICVGSGAANEQALSIAELDTRLLYFAAEYPPSEIKIDTNTLHYKRYKLIGVVGSDRSDFQEAAEMLDNGHVKVDKLIEKRFKLDEIQDAFKLASTPGTFRVSVHTWE